MERRTYTREQLDAMSTFNLRELAKNEGVQYARQKNRNQLINSLVLYYQDVRRNRR